MRSCIFDCVERDAVEDDMPLISKVASRLHGIVCDARGASLSPTLILKRYCRRKGGGSGRAGIDFKILWTFGRGRLQLVLNIFYF